MPYLMPLWEAVGSFGRIGALGVHFGYSKPGPTQGVDRGLRPWYNSKVVKSCKCLIEVLTS